jgi:hypothetical protein
MGAFAHTVRDRHTLCTGSFPSRKCQWDRVNFLIISRLPTRAQLFRRGHPQLCYDMRFAPQGESKFSSNSSVDSRSLLRVPSLNSNSGSADKRHTDERDDDAPSEADRNGHSQSSVVTGFKGPSSRRHSFAVHNGMWAASPSGMLRSTRQPPVFVNYRPEEMNLTPDGWQLSSNNNQTPPASWMNGQHLTTPPQQIGGRANGMPPYSPIRIRSARGARRLSINGNAIHRHSSPIGILPSQQPPNETLPSRGFPVSNRGMGRRNVAATLSAKSHQMKSTELAMLSKASTAEPPESIAMDVAVAASTVATKGEDVKQSRAVVKRKLPLMSTASSESSSSGEP